MSEYKKSNGEKEKKPNSVANMIVIHCSEIYGINLECKHVATGVCG